MPRHFPLGHPPRSPRAVAHRYYESTSNDGDELSADDGDQRKEGGQRSGDDGSLGNSPGPIWPSHNGYTGKL
jgi:hypothetical protein